MNHSISPTISTEYTYTTNTTTGISPQINWGVVSNGTGGLYTSPVYTISADPNLKGKTLSVKGDADFEGDLKLQGKSLKDSLDKIEERLAILYPNEELEKKWENLRELRKQYMELEAEIIEKEKIWAILKK